MGYAVLVAGLIWYYMHNDIIMVRTTMLSVAPKHFYQLHTIHRDVMGQLILTGLYTAMTRYLVSTDTLECKRQHSRR